MQPKRMVLFLGAGASVPFGYPTTNQILQRIVDSIRPNNESVAREIWAKWAVQQGEKTRADLLAALQLVLPGSGFDSDTSGASIIDVLSTIDYQISSAVSLSPKFRDKELREARQLLNIAMNGVMQGDLMKPYRQKIAEWIVRSAGAGHRISIVSTNYDCVLELPLYEILRVEQREAFEEVDFGTSVVSPSDRSFNRPGNAQMGVFKLHGSLNWLKCEVCGRLYVNTAGRILSLEFREKSDEFNTCACTGRLRGVLVAPSFIRDVREPHLLSIWGAALQELREATDWVFIGYSLPQEDVAIRSLLLRALHARTQDSLRIRVALKDELETARRAAPGAQPGQDAPRVQSDAFLRYLNFAPRSSFNPAADYFPQGAIEVLEHLRNGGL